MAPTYGLNDAPAALRRSLQKVLAISQVCLAKVGLQCWASSFDPCLLLVYPKEGGAVGAAAAAHIDGIVGCREQDVLPRTETFLEARSGSVKLQGSSFARVGMEMFQADDHSVRLNQADFPSKLAPLEISLALWVGWQQ